MICNSSNSSSSNNNNRRAVQFADTSTAYLCWYTFNNNDNAENDGARLGLWYTESEYSLMQRSAIRDALEVRSRILAGVFDYSGNDDGVCCVGIEHLLAQDDVRACIDRCIYAVLAQQAKQGSSAMDIALASLQETMMVTFRARMLGYLHCDSI